MIHNRDTAGRHTNRQETKDEQKKQKENRTFLRKVSCIGH